MRKQPRAGRSSEHRPTREPGRGPRRSRGGWRTGRRSLTAAVVSAAALVAFGGLAASASATRGAAETPAGSEAPASPANASLDRVPPHVRVEAQIRSVVASRRFADTYAGAVGREDGGVTIYATRSGVSEMAGALERLVGPPGPGGYELRPVERSYAALEALTQRLVQAMPSLKSRGVEPVRFGPEPASNTVEVEIPDYTAARARLITDQFGDDVTVVAGEHAEPLYVKENRYYDDPNFLNGAHIMPSGESWPCTHSFAVRGNGSGYVYGLTAGHCAGEYIVTHKTERHVMGRVSTNYYKNTNRDWDLESYRCSRCSIAGRVWYEGPDIGTNTGSTQHVAAICSWCDKVNELVTIDGADSGQVPHNTVTHVDDCFQLRREDDAGVYHWTCHLNQVKSFDQDVACDFGDSGGPVYQRSSNGEVFAAGVLVGGNNWGDICVYHDMGRVLNRTNATLLVG